MTPTQRFYSTRGKAKPVDLGSAIRSGLASDGGLYLPAFIPDIQMGVGSGRTFDQFAARLLLEWIGDSFTRAELDSICSDALNFDVPLVPLHGKDWDGVHVLELFHGPTLSFKDFGARTMAAILSRFPRREEEKLTILVATSGDTGSAVADGFAGHEEFRVVLLYPVGQVSAIQERQLIVERPGVTACAVDGTFDDCQRLVKGAFADPELESSGLTTANSINVGRLLPQMLFYYWAVDCLGRPVTFSVPSGNLGNLTAGMLAAKSGLPVHEFLASHNRNDFFPEYLREQSTPFKPSIRTVSNAMDVGAPSNFERLSTLYSHEELADRIHGDSVSDSDTLASMRRVVDETGYMPDPHTAVGLETVRRRRKNGNLRLPVVVLATAHPAKFPELVERATGTTVKPPERLARIWDRKTRVLSIAARQEEIRRVIRDV